MTEMKAKLIKVDTGWILMVDNKIYADILSIKNCQAIERGYDLDEMARKEILYNDQKREWWKQGFQKALEILGDKKFSEKDIIKAFNTGVEMLWSPRRYNDVLEELKKSLQQTEWDVEIEMEVWGRTTPKLDSDGCLILKLKSE